LLGANAKTVYVEDVRYNQKLWTGNMKKAAYPSV